MGEKNITPKLGLSIPGYFSERKSTGVKDDLFVKSVVFDDGRSVVAIIAIDVLYVQRDGVLAIRKRVNAITGINENDIMVTATHTHTGGPLFTILHSLRDSEYAELLVEKAADAVLAAYESRKACHIGFGIGKEFNIGFVRRYFMKDGSVQTNPGSRNCDVEGPSSPNDPDVAVIRIDDIDGRPVGVVTNFACHLDCVGGTEISADYSGELSRVFKRDLGENVISLFINGACGNINHIDLKHPEICFGREHYKRMGRMLAYDVLRVREYIQYGNVETVLSKSSLFKVAIRKPEAQDVIHATGLIDMVRKGITDEYGMPDEYDIGFAEELLKMAASGVSDIDVEVQVIKLGNAVIIALPGEMFSEFEIELKKKCRAAFCFISELSNGTVCGYIPTKEAFSQGGYEVRLTSASNLVPEAGDIIIGKAMELL
jgi:Neutral/alkaline non-lysosomal ceramidase.